MGPVPSGFTLETFIGKPLNQICIGPYDLQFRFDDKHGITCQSQGRVVLELDGQSTVLFDDETWGDVSALPRIVGRDVAAWKIEASYEFSVSLTDGAKLRFQSSDGYEDFVIYPGMLVV